MERFDLVVVGAGPSGLMATISARRRGKKVLLLEQNPEIGCKLKISGGGRCNLTNTLPPDEFLNRFGKWRNFFLPSFRAFDNFRTMRFFEDNGLALRVEEGRVFPASGKSVDVVRFFSRMLGSVGADVRLACRVRGIDMDKKRGVFVVKTDADEFLGSNVLIATGGVSFATKCGTRGDGLEWARKFGHRITRLIPHLCEVYIHEDLSPVKGITLSRVRISHRCKAHRINEVGPLIFTGEGLSGPLVHNLSMYLLDCPAREIFLDLLPDKDQDRLRREIEGLKHRWGNRRVYNLPVEGLPERLVRFRLMNFGEKRMRELSRREIQEVVERLKRWKLTVKGGPPIEWAFVTAGGVAVEEVDRRRLESKLVNGLFFAGEVLEVAGPSGGFNIQFALSTGWAVGNAV